MFKRITKQTFDLSKGLKAYFGRFSAFSIIGTLLILLLIPATIVGSWYIEDQYQQQQAQLEQKIVALKQDNQTLDSLYQEQIETNHTLSQSLSEKNDQIQLLGKRIFDVESVLGIADDEQLPEDGIMDSDLEQRIDAAAIDSAVRATMFRMIPNDSPVTYQRISSSYGRRINPITGELHHHTGIDLTCKTGDEIFAPADGVVETVRPSKKGYGNFLTVRHSFGFMSSFAHLHRFKVKSGQFVSKGDVIATCGNSGNSTGPHLHYEVRFLGRSLDPRNLMNWTPENFDIVFDKEKKVSWAPLVKLIDNTVRLQLNLTNSPYRDTSIDTVANERSRSQAQTN